MYNGTVCHGIQARDGLQQLFLAGAGDARDAENLAAHGREGDVVELFHALAVDAGDFLEHEPLDGIVIFRAVDVQRNRVTDHHVRQGLRIGVAGVDGADVLALAQDGDLVRQLHDLVELVRDDDDGLAVFFHVAQHGKELLRLLRRQHGGRLVKNQNVCTAVEHLDDLDRLLLRNGHIVDFLRRIDVEAVAVTDLLDLRICGLDVEAAALVQTEDDIFRGGEDIDQLVMLVNHADLVIEGILRRANGDGLAVCQDFALVGKVDACQHIHQRGLAAAVFAQQGENLTAPQTQTNAVVGDDRAEALGDIPQFDCVNSFQGCHPFLRRVSTGV